MDEVIDLVSSDEEDRRTESRRRPKKKRLIEDDEIIVLDADSNGASPSKSNAATTDSGSEDLSSDDSDAENEDGSGSSSEGSSATYSDSDSSDESTGSEDDEMSWHEFNYLCEGNSNDSFVSPEVEEERLKERFTEAMRLLFNENSHQQGFDSLTALLDESLIAAQRISNISSFDWEKAKSKYIRSCEPKLQMIAFGINRALARFADPCIGFYLQALALRPLDKSLWYEFGCAAAKTKEWRAAEMAFLECQADLNAVMKLALVHFYSKEYHKCLPLLKQILDKKPQNIAALVLKTEITKISRFWKFFVDFFFPPNPLLLPLPEIPEDVHQKVLAEMSAFTDADETPTHTFESCYSIKPLPSDSVKIGLDTSTEKFAQFICDFFDQSTAQQVPYDQQIHFVPIKRQRLSISESDCSMNDEMPGPSSVPMSDDIEIIEVVEKVVDDSIVVLEVVKKLLDDVDALEIVKPKYHKHKRKKTVDPFDLRRSTRNADEIPVETVKTPISKPKSNDYYLYTLLDLSKDTDFVPKFAGASGHALEDVIIDLTLPYHLDTFNGYLTILLNQSELFLEELLHSYLSFFATSLPTGCVMSDIEGKFFLEIYVRWISTFCQPFQQCCYTASSKDIAIHVVALELDPTGLTPANTACQLIFQRFWGSNVEADFVADDSTPTVNPSTNSTQKTSLEALRTRAITLLEEVDPPMAAKVKASLSAARIAVKAVTRDYNIDLAVGNVSFSNMCYRPIATVGPSTNKDAPTTSTADSNDMVEISNLTDEVVTVACVDDSDVPCCEATSQMPEIDFSKFVPLWIKLSKALKEHAKNPPPISIDTRGSSESLISMDSPLSDNEIFDVLNDIANGRDSPIEPDGITNVLADISSSQLDVKSMLTDYVTHLNLFVEKLQTEKLRSFDTTQWSDFLDETRRIVNALQLVVQKLESEKVDSHSQHDELASAMFARYLWIRYNRRTEAEDFKPILAALLCLMDVNTPIYTQLVGVEPYQRVVTAPIVSKLLTNAFRIEKSARIQTLFEEGQYNEVISQLATDFNWSCCTTAEVIANLRLLLSAFRSIGDEIRAITYICRMLDNVVNSLDGDADRDAIYADCLAQLNTFDYATFDETSLKALACSLVNCTEYHRFNQNITLWKVLYKVVAALEPEYDDATRLEMFDNNNDYPRLMPTKALCIIAECDHVLSNGKAPYKNDFIFFTIDEIYRAIGETPLSDNILSYSIGKTVQRNLETEMLRCLRALVDNNIITNANGDKEKQKKIVILADKIIHVLLRQLPMFDDVPKATIDTIDTICRTFTFIEEIRPIGLSETMQEFEAHLKSPPFFLFTVNENTQLVPQNAPSNAFTWPCLPVNDEIRRLAYLRYVVLVLRYRRAKTMELDEIRTLTKECLVLVGPADRNVLPVQFVHSLWALYALTSASAFSTLEDPELLSRFPWQFYLFKMAFLLYPGGFQLHLDVVNICYHVHARLRRYIKTLKSDSNEQKQAIAALEREQPLDQCQLHLDAFRHKITLTYEYPCDIAWLEAYFSGKIAEKRGASSKTVFEHYYRCALIMREEKYTYPLRIMRQRQEHAETLEIHYRVHTYALKRFRQLETKKLSQEVMTEVAEIRDYLRLFLGHFFFANKAIPPNLPSIPTLSFVRTMPPYGDFEDKKAVFGAWSNDDLNVAPSDNDEMVTLSLLTAFTDAKVECMELIRFAYESIFRRFPHYKSIYRLAEIQTFDKDFNGAINTIMRLYGNGKFSFENVSEFLRTDFERSGSMTYHLSKLITLTTKCLITSDDTNTHRATSIMINLAKYNEWEKVSIPELVRITGICSCLGVFYKAIEAAQKDSLKLTNLTKQLIKAGEFLNFPKAEQILKMMKDKISQYQKAIVEASNAERRAKLAIVEERQKQALIQQKQQQLILALQAHMKQQEELKRRQDEEAARKKREEIERKKREEAQHVAMLEAARLKRLKEKAEQERIAEAKLKAAQEAAKLKQLRDEAERAERKRIEMAKQLEAERQKREALQKREKEKKEREMLLQTHLRERERQEKEAQKLLENARKMQQFQALLQQVALKNPTIAGSTPTVNGSTAAQSVDPFEAMVHLEMMKAEEKRKRDAEAHAIASQTSTPTMSGESRRGRPSLSEDKKRERDEKLKQRREQEERIQNKLLQPVVTLKIAEEQRKREEDCRKRAQDAVFKGRVNDQSHLSQGQQQHNANAILIQVKVIKMLENCKELPPELMDEIKPRYGMIVNEILATDKPDDTNIIMGIVVKHLQFCNEKLVALKLQREQMALQQRSKNSAPTTSVTPQSEARATPATAGSHSGPRPSTSANTSTSGRMLPQQTPLGVSKQATASMERPQQQRQSHSESTSKVVQAQTHLNRVFSGSTPSTSAFSNGTNFSPSNLSRKRTAPEPATPTHASKMAKSSSSVMPVSAQASTSLPSMRNGTLSPSKATSSSSFPHNFPLLAQQVANAIPSKLTKDEDDIVVIKEVKSKQKPSSRTVTTTNHVDDVVNSVALRGTNSVISRPTLVDQLPSSSSQPVSRGTPATTHSVSRNSVNTPTLNQSTSSRGGSSANTTYQPPYSNTPKSMSVRGLTVAQQQQQQALSAQLEHQKQLRQQQQSSVAALMNQLLVNDQQSAALMHLASVPGAIDKLSPQMRQQLMVLMENQRRNKR